MKLYLASTSPRRLTILKHLNLKFTPLKPSITEPEITNTTHPERLATTIALLKALSCTRYVKNGLLIGMDTIVVINNQVLGKPGNRSRARKMLKLLSGKTHQVITAIALIKLPECKIFTSAEKTLVTFRTLSRDEIEAYIQTSEPYDKAGAYAIQGKAGLFVSKINGCYLNVIGLPLPRLLNLLKKAGWKK
uniref:dTTP/UTP pyrophosphatase n=1 Tax=candidate division WOR-3 bacterium TaxID=2052148 RepID=A0A7V3PUD8_UNCW3